LNWRVPIVWGFRLLTFALLIWSGGRWLRGFDSVYATGDTFTILNYMMYLLAICVIGVGLFFVNVFFRFGNSLAKMFYPDDDQVELHPQYSVPEARVCEGKYEEAIVEFRKVWNDYPHDVNAHVRIAELLCQHFQRYDDAVRELRAALEKRCKPEAWAFVANRLVDVQVEYLRDFVSARATLQEIILKFPSTKYAESARARVMALNDKEEHVKQHPRPRLKVPDTRDDGKV
jgi:tetratricopeptide (TPR) repeat protein